ncbi:MAG: hypothetical protein ACI80V_000482 [Rhodothermales bacterium]|jgi:hypothetical protein
MTRFLPLLLLAFLAACTGTQTEAEDPNEGYEAFGEAMTDVDAIPVQAVVAEADQLLGKPVKLEGRIAEVCQGMGCWLSLQVVDGPLVRIDVPRDQDGNYVYTFPKDASGRRAVVSGVLMAGAAHDEGGEMADHHPEGSDMDGHDAAGSEMADHHAEGADMDGHDDRETAVMNETVYTLIATGALLERVRA